MLLKKSFAEFLQKRVDLNQSRVDRIKSAHSSVRGHLCRDSWVSARGGDTILQGSYALRTAIKSPFGARPYDVDVVLGMNLSEELDPIYAADVLQEVQEALEEVPLYSGKTSMLERCIRVEYSSDGLDFHLDVLPAHKMTGTWEPLQIPRDWRVTNPMGYIKWFQKTNADRCGYLPKVVRLLKFWRDLHDLKEPNSMVLTTLAGLNLPIKALSVDHALVLVLEGITEWADAQETWESPKVPNPSLPSENLARNWDAYSFESFQEQVRDASRDARAALDSRDEKETIEYWNGENLFDGQFPTVIRGLSEQLRQTARAFDEGSLKVATGGIIGATGITPRNNQGFYGDS